MATEKKKRYICSFVKNINGELKPNVVVVAASNSLMAKVLLCKRYEVKNVDIPKERHKLNDMEGIKTIRIAETNVYEGGSVNDNFDSDDSET